MTKLPALIVIAAIASAASALPALAQSFDPDAGTGNIVPFNAAPPALPQPRVAARPRGNAAMAAHRSGQHSFALVPGNSGGGNVDN
jgi:hypothetical protein